ncbi:MAG: AAA family ATPase [Candidatus Micrarchaeia archaeon]
MESSLFSKTVAESTKKIRSAAAYKEQRYLFHKLKGMLGKGYYIGVYGLRGIGKTVMMLQLASTVENPLYVSVDSAYLANYSIYEIAEEAFKNGYKNLFIDEIQSRKGWEKDLKTLYDEGEINVFFTGSSPTNIKTMGADLSRRALIYELLPPSLREYLNIKKGTSIEKVDISSLFDESKRREIAIRYSAYSSWYEYFSYGGILYDAKIGFPKPVINMLERIISLDLAAIRSIDSELINDVHKLLYKLAESGPYELSYNSIANYLQVSVKKVIGIVKDLESVGLLKLVYPSHGGMRKEPKVYFRLPFRFALNESVGAKTDLGVAREEFFVNSASVSSYVKTERGEKTPDFVVEGRTIEVGGAGKRNYQKADFIAVDSLDFIGNKIPLFLFGFLY